MSLRRLLFAALLAGLVGGLAFWAAQTVTTRPLIVQAELLEATAHASAAPHDHGWEPGEGIERTAYTVAADVMIGIGYAFVLLGAMSMTGRVSTWRSGLAWGAAGFVVFAAAPALGLPPEPPGAQSADLLLRQAWWIGTTAATAAGLWMLLLQDRRALRLLGAVLLVLPHVVGSPHVGGGEPAYLALAAQFLWASLAANAALWAALGLAAGIVQPRFAGASDLTPARA